MKGRSHLFILHGNGPLQNRGCEAILRSTVSILREEFGVCRFVNFPGYITEPERIAEPDSGIRHLGGYAPRWSARWFNWQIQKRLFGREPFERYLSKSLATLALGGDNYSLDYGEPRRYFHANSLTLKRKKPLILWGASVGPFDKNPQFEEFAAKELKKVTLICARESQTIAYLRGLGITENVQAVSDPAFVLEPEAVNNSSLLRILEQPCIGLNFSPLMERYWKGEKSWLLHARECVEAIIRYTDRPIILIPHVIYPGNDDHDFMKQIRDNLGKYQERVTLLNPEYNASQIKWIISQLSAFVGARTHSTIAALSSNVPTISVGYSMKARGLNKDIFGHCDWLIPLEHLERDMLASQVGKLLDGARQIRDHLGRVMKGYKARAKVAAKYVREVIER